jgi:D-3-phosphoglycerate dehydrogenase
VGTTLAEFDINVSRMTLGRKQPRGRALMVLGLDEAPTEEQIARIERIPDIFGARLVRF